MKHASEEQLTLGCPVCKLTPELTALGYHMTLVATMHTDQPELPSSPLPLRAVFSKIIMLAVQSPGGRLFAPGVGEVGLLHTTSSILVPALIS